MKDLIGIEPEEIIRIIARWRWLIMIPFCLSMLVGSYYARTSPKIYEASTLVLNHPRQVSRQFIPNIVNDDISASINTLAQQITSRSIIEKVLKQVDPYNKPHQAKLSFSKKVEKLRRKIIVNVSRERRNTNSFIISFNGHDPEVVMKVVNMVATIFIEENARQREAQAFGTSEFLASEIKDMHKRLEKMEIELEIFPLKQELATLQEKYTGAHPDIVRIKKRITEIERNQQIASAGTAQVPESERRLQETPMTERELLSLQRDYDNMRESYTSLLNHKLQADIAANLEQQQKGAQFRIIDSASFPDTPVGPDMRKIFILFVGIGLGIGGGVIFLLEFLNTSFKTVEDMEAILDLPVVATLPIEKNFPRALFVKQLNLVCSSVALAAAIILFAKFSMETVL